MHKNNFYILFGVWLIILPFFGIPSDWKNVLVLLSGILILVINFGPIALKKLQSRPRQKTKKKKDSDEQELRFSSPDDINPEPPL